MIMFKEFKIENLFDTHVVSKKLTKAAFSPEGVVPAYSSDTRNNGILGYTEEEPTFIVDETQPTYVLFGDHTRTINIVHDSFCVMDNVKVLSPKLNLSDEVLLYIKTVWLKSIPVLGYARHWGVAKDIVLSLPVQVDEHNNPLLDDDGNFIPDWDYMEQFIKEIECSQISKLDVYLQETGLNDTRLTEEEQTLLSAEPTFGEFKVGDLFDVEQGRRLKKSDFQDGDIPFVMASSKNNGVVAYLSNPVTTNTNFITVDILGNVFYQDGLVGYGDDNCGLKLKNGHQSEAVYLYLTTVISKFKPMASYGNKLRGKWYTEQLIQLPLKPGTDVNHTSEDDIDWDYMEAYIRVMEKQVIANTVTYKDTLIAKTKELVN